MSQTRRILPGGHKHHRFAAFGRRGDRNQGSVRERPRQGMAERARTEGGGGWGMGPLGESRVGAFFAFSGVGRVGAFFAFSAPGVWVTNY